MTHWLKPTVLAPAMITSPRMSLAPASLRLAEAAALGGGLKHRTVAGARVLACVAPSIIVALAGLLLLWSRLLPITNSLWSDEAFTALYYIRPGPAAIFGHYIPNDHMLFELLSWATTNLIGDSSEAALRFWSVVPAIAAGVIMTWGLWRRLDSWVAAIFAVLAAAAPVYMNLSIEARGYGLAFLAAALMVIATDSLMWKRRRRDLLLFAGSAIAGIWTLPVLVLAFLPLTALLMSREPSRRDAVRALIVVGVASLLFYLPVIGDLVASSGQQYGSRLPWYGVISRPLTDLITPSVSLLLPGASLVIAELIGGSLIGVGVGVLWRHPDRFLALALVSPALFSYLFLEIGRFYEADRFVSFVELPLLALVAIALVQAGRLLARAPAGNALTIAIAIAIALFTLGKAQTSFKSAVQEPIENFREAGALTNASGIPTIVSNSTKPVGFFYYLSVSRVHLWTPAELEPLFCSNVAPFVYLEHGRSPLANTTCLRDRNAVSIRVPQTRSYIRVWLVRSPLEPVGNSSVTPAPPVLTAAPLSPGVIDCPPVVERLSAPSVAAPLPVGQPFTAKVGGPLAGEYSTVRLTVIGSRVAGSVPGQFTGRKSVFTAPGSFLVVRYRITNLGPTSIKPEDTVNALFGVSGATPGGLVASAATFDQNCTLVGPSVSSILVQPSPYTQVRTGQTIETLAVYPLPAGASVSGASQQLTWTAATLGITAALPRPRLGR
jgi:hypothetical protein